MANQAHYHQFMQSQLMYQDAMNYQMPYYQNMYPYDNRFEDMPDRQQYYTNGSMNDADYNQPDSQDDSYSNPNKPPRRNFCSNNTNNSNSNSSTQLDKPNKG